MARSSAAGSNASLPSTWPSSSSGGRALDPRSSRSPARCASAYDCEVTHWLGGRRPGLLGRRGQLPYGEARGQRRAARAAIAYSSFLKASQLASGTQRAAAAARMELDRIGSSWKIVTGWKTTLTLPSLASRSIVGVDPGVQLLADGTVEVLVQIEHGRVACPGRRAPWIRRAGASAGPPPTRTACRARRHDRQHDQRRHGDHEPSPSCSSRPALVCPTRRDLTGLGNKACSRSRLRSAENRHDRKASDLAPDVARYILDHSTRPTRCWRSSPPRPRRSPATGANADLPRPGDAAHHDHPAGGARNVAVEVGTFTGYSSLCIARGLPRRHLTAST